MTRQMSPHAPRSGLLARLGHARALELSQSIRLTPADAGDMTLAHMKSLRAQGVWKLILDTEVSLDPDNALNNAGFLAVLCLLRDATRLGLTVDWRLGNIPKHVYPCLGHLTPPDTSSVSNKHQTTWRRHFSFGQFFWKKGPGFAVVIDRRNPDKNHKFVITGEAALSTFLLLSEGRPHTGTAGLEGKNLEILENAGIVLRLGVHSIILPYRLSHPPVPAYAIENI